MCKYKFQLRKQMKQRLIPILLFFTITAFGQKLPIGGKIISGKSETLWNLFDGNTQTGWFPGWNSADYPVQFSVDLGKETNISKIRIFDGFGSPNLTVFSGATVFVNTPLNSFMSWREFAVNKKAQILIFEISDIQGEFPMFEVEVYGNTDTIKPPPPPIITSGTTNSIGLNGFHWVPFDNIPCTHYRMYQFIQWTWTVDGLAVEPTRQANGNYDTWLTEAKQRGIKTVFCPNKVPDFIVGNDVVNSDPEWQDRRLHSPNANPTDPKSYSQICEYYWQLAARYGSKKWPDEKLKVNQIPRWTNDPVTQKKSGLNLLQYIEIENEPDRPWKNDLHKYTAEQYAALLSAAYDAIKDADPEMNVVMGGLSAIDITYLARMNAWFKTNRADKKFPNVIINVHHYANSKNPYPGNSINFVDGSGVSPEEDHIGDRLKELWQWTHDNIGKRDIWYSEFGWDTEPCSLPIWLCQSAKIYGSHTKEQLQGWWAVRTYLIAIESGISISHIFNAINEPNAETGNLFLSCGISLGESPQNGIKFAKKPAYYEIKWLTEQLSGYSFFKSQSIPGITILEFRNGRKSRYFYWSPTSNDTVKTFKIGKATLNATEKVQVYDIKRPLIFSPTIPLPKNEKSERN